MLIIPKVTLGSDTYANVEVEFGEYSLNGAESIQLWVQDDLTREPLCTATVNLMNVVPDIGCVLIKDYSENSGVLAALMEAGIVEPTGASFRTGFVEVPEVRILKRS